MQNVSFRTWRIALPLMMMAAIFIESSLPAPEFIYIIQDRSWIRRDDMLHTALYMALGLCWCWALRCPSFLSTASAIAWGITALYGISDEFHQTLVSCRTGELRECFDDAIGATLALGFWNSWGWVRGWMWRNPLE